MAKDEVCSNRVVSMRRPSRQERVNLRRHSIIITHRESHRMYNSICAMDDRAFCLTWPLLTILAKAQITKVYINPR